MKKRILGAALAASLTVSGLSTVAFAGTGSSFDSQYQAKLSQETQLLQQAQSANFTDSNVGALLNTAQNINTQVAALYTAEQALVSGKSSIPSVSTDSSEKVELAKLNKERTSDLNQSNNDWNLVKKYSHNKEDKQYLNKAIKDHNATQSNLNDINKQIETVEGKIDQGNWKSHPYDGGLSGLQDSILKLEDSSIHYTDVAIQLEQADTASNSSTVTDNSGNTTTNTGNTNTTGTTTTSSTSS